MSRTELIRVLGDLAQQHQTQNPDKPNPHTAALHNAVRYFDRKGMLELWTGSETMKSLKFNRFSHMKNREAEESKVRKDVWGWEDKDGDEMKDESSTHFGDVYHGQKMNPWLMSMLAAGVLTLLTMIPLAAIAAAGVTYLMSQDDTELTDETVQIGLGKIEDYLKPSDTNGSGTP